MQKRQICCKHPIKAVILCLFGSLIFYFAQFRSEPPQPPFGQANSFSVWWFGDFWGVVAFRVAVGPLPGVPKEVIQVISEGKDARKAT